MLSPRQIRCQTKQEARVGTCSQVFSRRSLVPLLGSFYRLCSGFTATRSLGEYPQRVSRLSPASLLEFVNPIGYRLNHIARGFTRSVCLCFNSWARFLALFYDSNCFLLRHCLFSSFRLILNVSNEIPATQFPKFLELERLTAIRLAKNRPHPLTRRFRQKRVTDGRKTFGRRLISAWYGRKPYRLTGTVALLQPQ